MLPAARFHAGIRTRNLQLPTIFHSPTEFSENPDLLPQVRRDKRNPVKTRFRFGRMLYVGFIYLLLGYYYGWHLPVLLFLLEADLEIKR